MFPTFRPPTVKQLGQLLQKVELWLEPVFKSVSQTVTNLLTVLAQQGNPAAIAALERANDLDGDVEFVENDGAGSVKVVLDTAEGNHLITQHGQVSCLRLTRTERVTLKPIDTGSSRAFALGG
ncbi:hypothetical protein H6G00_17805 [Leptolyngbya sp. FACHB-541]|uniref:hypothetical protein n=1 Tax=Leptolyngbya sp. FACHB-541 TaxID=2692810 RepID=UPI001686EBC5|nr:hypothetical protein [Leptolyngbya sp. FACHB-541]MBD1998462.1 hypothetical protein [Leptolyngbya sp. FACHB-541]